MIKIQTSYIKDFLNKASRIPANKFLTISEYILFEAQPHANSITLTYTGTGASVRQTYTGTVSVKTSFLCETRALTVAIQNGKEIEISKEGEAVKMVCGGSTINIATVDESDYTCLIEDVEGEPITLNEDAIKAIAAANILCPSPDGKGIPNMTAVHLSAKDGGCEVMATNSFSMLVQQIDLPIAKNYLISKEMCATLSIYTEAQLHEKENKYIVIANNTEYAFVKPDLTFIKSYKELLQGAIDKAEQVGFIHKDIITSFCEQSKKLTTNPAYDVILSVKDGNGTLSMKDDYLSVDNSYSFGIEAKDLSIRFEPEKIINGIKAIPSDALEIFDDKQHAMLKANNTILLFLKKQ